MRRGHGAARRGAASFSAAERQHNRPGAGAVRALRSQEGRTHAGLQSVFGAVFSLVDLAWCASPLFAPWRRRGVARLVTGFMEVLALSGNDKTEY